MLSLIPTDTASVMIMLANLGMAALLVHLVLRKSAR